MSTALFLEQLLNGLQLGVMLFLMAAGLTLIFGVMGLINLAHGSLFMVGGFVCAAVAAGPDPSGSALPPAWWRLRRLARSSRSS
jgi:branched-subunit amino acid ABC-type transport system permease component